MTKKIEWQVVCPECDLLQTYHSHKKQVEGVRQKVCNRCGFSFACKKRRLSVLPVKKKKLRKEREEKGTGFHKYSKK